MGRVFLNIEIDIFYPNFISPGQENNSKQLNEMKFDWKNLISFVSLEGFPEIINFLWLEICPIKHMKGSIQGISRVNWWYLQILPIKLHFIWFIGMKLGKQNLIGSSSIQTSFVLFTDIINFRRKFFFSFFWFGVFKGNEWSLEILPN